jgi:hypothetical protein
MSRIGNSVNSSPTSPIQNPPTARATPASAAPTDAAILEPTPFQQFIDSLRGLPSLRPDAVARAVNQLASQALLTPDAAGAAADALLNGPALTDNLLATTAVLGPAPQAADQASLLASSLLSSAPTAAAATTLTGTLTTPTITLAPPTPAPLLNPLNPFTPNLAPAPQPSPQPPAPAVNLLALATPPAPAPAPAAVNAFNQTAATAPATPPQSPVLQETERSQSPQFLALVAALQQVPAVRPDLVADVARRLTTGDYLTVGAIQQVADVMLR